MHIMVESRMRCILLLCYTIYTLKVITGILRWRLFGGFSGCPILRSTILDKIAEFAKIIAGLNFCVRATL